MLQELAAGPDHEGGFTPGSAAPGQPPAAGSRAPTPPGQAPPASGPTVDVELLPGWAQELLRFLPARSGFVIHGNIHDFHAYPLRDPAAPGSPVIWRPLGIESFLHRLLREQGYQHVVFWDLVDGFRAKDGPPAVKAFLEVAEKSRPGPEGAPAQGARPAGGDGLRGSTAPSRTMDLARQGVANAQASVAVIINLASRLLTDPRNLTEGEREIFTRV